MLPKLIVLFDENDVRAAALAEQAVAGARQIRFTEVDRRSVGGGDPARVVVSGAAVRESDAVLLAYAGDEIPAPMAAAIRELTAGRQLPNLVVGVTGGSGEALRIASQMGGIIVSVPGDASVEGRAHDLGARMARVSGWVRHALGHEAEHSHH